MSLNCLTCGGQVLQRENSEREYFTEIKVSRKVPNIKVGRTWSGNISPPQCAAATGGGAVAKIKKEHHRRTNSAGNVGPRLVRSSGMRRDWSFEDLNVGQQEKGAVRCYWDSSLIYMHICSVHDHCWVLNFTALCIILSWLVFLKGGRKGEWKCKEKRGKVGCSLM